MALPIEHYAILGDTGTAALVGLDGSIDWLCLPRFDSAACFAALLGTSKHGRWLVGPVDAAETTRAYRGHSFVLETTHRTASGTVKVTDLMPIGDGRADIVRIVEGLDGTVRMRNEWIVRFGYGRIRPWVSRGKDLEDKQIITAIAGPDKLVFRGDRLPKAKDGTHVDEFDVAAGERYTFTTTWFASHRPVPGMLEVPSRIAQTLQRSQDWAELCTYDGRYREHVVRSLLVLRLLTHGGTGGIVAAPTTSLPEEFGGERNWDYRFCWLRDASLTVEALLSAGYRDEVELWRGWLLRALAGDPKDAQILYGVDGSRDLPERTLAHLPGYEGSRPVRVGNGAVDQRQTDVLGEVMSALEHARDEGVDDIQASWRLQRLLVDEMCTHWDEPDNGIWEVRGDRRHFTHSRVMMWVALDCAIQAVEQHGLPGDTTHWREIAGLIRDRVLTEGYDADRNTFVQHNETTEVDASLLLIPMVGFLPGDDPRVLGTIEAVEQDLMRDGLLRRYRTEANHDGVQGDEHPFLACSFWLVSAYALAGRSDEAFALMDRLVGLANDVGLLSEEYDVGHERFAGNFPQAFSHLALVNAAMHLDGPERVRREHRVGRRSTRA